MRLFACMILAVVLPSVGLGQSAQQRPAFEAADIQLSPHSSMPFMSGGILRGGRYVLRKATMLDMIRTAYGIDADNVIGGPSWLETDRFEVTAKIPPSTPPDTVPLMLQTLLAERFKLVVHKDSKPMQVFVLSAGKGKPKLKESVEGAGNPGCQPQRGPDSGPPGYISVSCHNITMAAFATELNQMAGGYLTMPVVDQTNLKGSWDFDVTWTGRGALQAAGADGISIFAAVERLGLKLEAQKVPMPVIVVDSVNQKPTDNPPGVTTSLPPAPPTEFEVADIKPSPPGTPSGGGGIQPGGRIDLRGVPLRLLIAIAWNINPGDEIPGAPKFVDSATFDLVAKAYNTSGGPTNGPPIDIDDLRLMVRNLLIDRFKLKTHYEDRPMNAYTLVAAKPKLKKADPSNRTGCKSGPAPIGKDATAEPGLPTFLATCQNITMAQFAEQLPIIAPVYLHTPVLDSTGLEGAWDFSFNFSRKPPVMGGGRNGGGGDVRPADPGASSASTPSASEPGTALTLFDAINKQLGLKLELQKRPMPVLVIDHVEEKPTDN